jgi:hypothetical protein
MLYEDSWPVDVAHQICNRIAQFLVGSDARGTQLHGGRTRIESLKLQNCVALGISYAQVYRRKTRIALCEDCHSANSLVLFIEQFTGDQ